MLIFHLFDSFFSLRSTSEYIKDIIYGGLDGIVSVFVTGNDAFFCFFFHILICCFISFFLQVAAGTGSSESVYASLVLGIAKWFAGAVRESGFRFSNLKMIESYQWELEIGLRRMLK